ncbi:MAG: alpha/beta hydrolase, partial [Actinomycetota bacterium]
DPEEELYRGLLKGLVDPNTAGFMSANGAEALKAAWTDASETEIEDYCSVFGDVDAMQAAMNYYVACRSHARALDGPLTFGDVSTPTLLLWGKNDLYIRPTSLELAKPFMKGSYRVVELDAGHWLIQEREDEVRDEILTHLKENPL